MTIRIHAILAIIMLALSAAAPAAARGTPDSFADLVENLTPAVVNISSAQNVGGMDGVDALAPFQEKLGNQAVSLGSGFIIDPDGLVVTNNHVVEDADEITVTLNDGREFTAFLRGRDVETDLAVLQLRDASGLPSVRFGDSRQARVGDWVVAIGNPFGLGGSVSAGIISAENRDINSGLYDSYIQTDAAINRGNSGGPLFNMQGDVIGVNTAIFSQTGGSVGVGFAVPADLASRVVGQLAEFGETRRGWLGVTLEELSRDRAIELGLGEPKGALVVGVRPESPALYAGILQNDVIIRFNNRDVEEVRDLTRAVADTPVGSTVPVRLLRDGRTMNVRVTVTRREDALRVSATGGFEFLDPESESATTLSGLTLQEPTQRIRDAYGIAPSVEGVVVTAVDPNSDIANVLQPGDVITKLGFDRITDPSAAAERMEKLRNLNSGPVQVEVRRGDMLFYELIRP